MELMLLGLLGLWGYGLLLYSAWRLGYFRWPEPRDEEPLPLSFFLGSFGIFATVYLVIPPLIFAVLQLLDGGETLSLTEPTMEVYAWVSLGLYLLLPSCLFAFGRLALGAEGLHRLLFREQKLSASKIFNDISLGMVSWTISIVPVAVTNTGLQMLLTWWQEAPLEDQLPIRQLKQSVDLGFLYWLVVAAMIVLIPILEELLFRGVLQSWLRTRIGRPLAIVFTSLVFSAVHYSNQQGLANIPILCSLFLFSLGLGFVFERQRSILAPITLHSTFNFVSILMLHLGTAK